MSERAPAQAQVRRLRPLDIHLGVVVLLLILWGSVWHVLRTGEQQALQSADRNNANLALVVAQHAEVTLNQADRMALQLRELLAEPADFARRSASMKRLLRSSESILQAAVAASDGTIIWTTLEGPAATIRDREHFRVHLERDLGRAFVSKPVLGRVSGNWSVQVTRRVNDADGNFAGVVVLSLDPFFFTRRFAQLDIGPSGRVALVGADGVVRARTTGSQQESAGDILTMALPWETLRAARAGTFSSVGTVDSVTRLDAFRAVGDYELFALVGVARTDALGAFLNGRRGYLVFGALVSVLLLAMAKLMVRGLQREFQLLEQAERARERAERSNVRKTEFVGAIAHEVRTPLSNIIGYAQLIASGKAMPDRHALFARQVEAAGVRVSETMNDLLEIARIEAGSLTLTPTRVSIRELVSDCVDAFEDRASAKGLVLHAEIDPAVPEILELDRSRVEQILTHLVGNAIRHTGKGTLSLQLARDDDVLRISVTDEGEGISEELLASLFNRFDGDASPVALRVSGGSLGLSIVKAIVDRMGGQLRAEANRPMGTCIEARLPLVVPR